MAGMRRIRIRTGVSVKRGGAGAGVRGSSREMEGALAEAVVFCPADAFNDFQFKI